MKKILFATTALVVTAGAAAADITTVASANMGVKYMEGRANGETYLWNELDFGINASSTTDAGLEFGASIDLDASSNDGTNKNDTTDYDPEVYISSGGLTLTIGDVDPASDDMGISDIGFDGIGIDDVAEGAWNEGSANVLVAYEIAGFTVMASADGTAGDDWSVALYGDVAGLGFGITYEEASNDATTGVMASYGFGAFTVGGVYFDGEYANSYGVQGDYKMGDLGLRLVISQYDGDAAGTDSSAYGVGASYDLGSGLAVAGGVGVTDPDGADSYTTADFGLTMKF